MALTTEAPKFSKKRKLGKGKKKAWRTANIKDLEEFLDDERRQHETGGLASEKANEKLFYVDKGKAPTKLSRKPVSKEDRKIRPLRSCALLEPSQNIESVIAPLKEDYKKGKKSRKILDNIMERATSQVRVAAIQQRQNYVKGKITANRQKRELPEVTSDIWNDDEIDTVKVKIQGNGNADNSVKLLITTDKQTKKRPKKLLSKSSKLSATIVPHPGASINPSYEDHQDLLQKALETEEDKRKVALRTVNALQLSNKRTTATKETYLAEMSAGLIDDSESEDEEKEDNNNDIQPSVRVPNRKTKRQRKAEAKLGEQMREKKAVADRNRRESMIYRIRSLKSEIRQQDVKEVKKSEARLKLKEEEPFKTKRLGKMKFEEPTVELKLSEELVASMRQFKPEGNVLDDVYKSMIRRNIMEPRAKQKKKRKYKLKTYVKKTHKVMS